MTIIIDGKTIASQLRTELTEKVKNMSVKPGLAVVLVGSDPASDVYVRNKAKSTKEVGMNSFEYRLDASTSEADLITLIQDLNNKEDVHGILVQSPVPSHIDYEKIVETIDPKKDVDGFHDENIGKLVNGREGFVACTPLGCLKLLKTVIPDLSGKKAVIIGRSTIVGKPMSMLLLNESCTVTVCHSRTQNIEEECRSADILIAAVGKAKLVKKDWVKPGAVVIDVGINRNEEGKLVGDVDFDDIKDIAGAITPVPGGVGPMTIACLLYNTVKAAEAF